MSQTQKQITQTIPPSSFTDEESVFSKLDQKLKSQKKFKGVLLRSNIRTVLSTHKIPSKRNRTLEAKSLVDSIFFTVMKILDRKDMVEKMIDYYWDQGEKLLDIATPQELENLERELLFFVTSFEEVYDPKIHSKRSAHSKHFLHQGGKKKITLQEVEKVFLEKISVIK